MALDQGTTSSRAILFDAAGQIVASAGRELPQIYPQAGWVEHDPNAIWNTQRDSIQALLEKSGVAPVQIAALGIANQRETAVAWQRSTGEPLCNAIVWQCRRTAARCLELEAQGLTDTIRQKTGLVLDAYFSGPKFEWILQNVPRAGELAAQDDLCLGTVDAWLIARLTGLAQHVTDATNASRTMLYDIHAHAWDDDLLACFGIPREALPQVVPSSGVVGYTDRSVFGAAVPIAGIAGDQQAALFGQTCWEPGHAKNTYGTGCFLLSHTGAQATASHAGLLTTVAASMHGNAYALEGSVFVAGAAVQWFAGQAGRHRHGGGERNACPSGPRFRRCGRGAGVYRFGHALLGPTGAGHHSRLDAGLDQSARRSRYLGSNCIANARRGRDDAAGIGRCVAGTPGGRRRGGQRAPDADPSRSARHPGGRARSYGDHSARRGVLGRAWRGLLAGRGGSGGAVAHCPTLRTPNQRRRARIALRHLATCRRTRPCVGNRIVASGRYHEVHMPTTAQPVIKIALRRSCCDKVVCQVPSAQRNNLHIRH